MGINNPIARFAVAAWLLAAAAAAGADPDPRKTDLFRTGEGG
jgi:hypothetical protein